MIEDSDRFFAESLTKEIQPRKMYFFYVTGRLEFPLDMLRYDCCWPANQEAAAHMHEDEWRSIYLASYQKPTIERWSSFMWSVGKEKLY